MANGNLNQSEEIDYRKHGTYFNDDTIIPVMSTGHLENFRNEALIDDILPSYRHDYDFQTDWDDLLIVDPS